MIRMKRQKRAERKKEKLNDNAMTRDNNDAFIINK